MAEKRDYNSKMNAKGLESSVSESQAREMCENQGSQYLLLVKVHAGPKTVDEDGSEKVNLIPDVVELVPAEHAEKVQSFMEALKWARPDQHGQEAFSVPQEGAPSVDEAAAALSEWDGNPDAPDNGDVCPAPDCALKVDHDGDHDPLTDAEAPGSKNVVDFSSKAK